MKKYIYRIAVILLMGLLTVGLYLSTSESTGLRNYLSKMNSAKKNASKSDYKEVRVLPSTKKAELSYDPYAEDRVLTGEDFNHIWLAGERYEFPLCLDDLPDGFSWELNEELKYVGVTLRYNGIAWAHALRRITSEDRESVYEKFLEDKIIDTLQFTYNEEDREFLPEILVAGYPINEFDSVVVGKALGYHTGALAYWGYVIPLADGEGFYSVSCLDEKGLRAISYSTESGERGNNFYLTGEKETLPEEYLPEEDLLNQSFECPKLPEHESKMQLALENLRVNGKKLQLPCTVEHLMYTLGIEEVSYTSLKGGYILEEEGGVNERVTFVCGELSVGERELFFRAIPSQGEDRGRLVVVSLGETVLDVDLEKDDQPLLTFENLQIDYETGEVTSAEAYEWKGIQLTQYDWNNVIIERTEGGTVTDIRYWPWNIASWGDPL